VLLYSVFHLFVCSFPVFGNTEYRSTTNKQMKYRIQEHYKQTDEIQNKGALQTNRWNTEHRNTTNKQMKQRIQEHNKQTNETPNRGALQTNKWNTEYRSTTNKQMKYRIQEHYKQTDEIQKTGTIQTNRLNTEHRNTTNKHCIRYFICLFVVFLYSVFHLFVCSAPVFCISSVCL
jgi:hypothetical protein